LRTEIRVIGKQQDREKEKKINNDISFLFERAQQAKTDPSHNRIWDMEHRNSPEIIHGQLTCSLDIPVKHKAIDEIISCQHGQNKNIFFPWSDNSYDSSKQKEYGGDNIVMEYM
jgi:hypothetical protein